MTDEHFEQAAQKAAQQAHATARNEPQAQPAAHENPPVLLGSASSCETLQNRGVGDTGLEPVTPSLSSSGPSIVSGYNKELRAAQSAACTRACTSDAEIAHDKSFDDDLAVLIDAWPSLPPAVRQSIVKLVKVAAKRGAKGAKQ